MRLCWIPALRARMTGAANANFGTCGNGGNDEGGNDGGKWESKRESTFAAPIVIVGNPSVMVVVKNAVILVVIVISGVILVIVIGIALFVILVSVVIGGIVSISVVVDTRIVMLTKSSLPCTTVIVKSSALFGGL